MLMIASRVLLATIDPDSAGAAWCYITVAGVEARDRASGGRSVPRAGGAPDRPPGHSIRRQRLAALEWDKTHSARPDRDEFTRDILPHLEGVSYSALSRASGLSRRYCKLIATGQYVPHPVH
jgi:hypothetical protein